MSFQDSLCWLVVSIYGVLKNHTEWFSGFSFDEWDKESSFLLTYYPLLFKWLPNGLATLLYFQLAHHVNRMSSFQFDTIESAKNS